MFDCCKTFFGKYIFFENVNFWKIKMFPLWLVAFQKNFRKIFYGVWKRRRKTQIQKNTSHNPDRVVRRLRRRSRSEITIVISPSSQDRNREIAIDGAISRSVDGNLDLVQSHEGEIAIFARSRQRQSRFGAISQRRDRDLDSVRSRSRSGYEIAINGAIS